MGKSKTINVTDSSTYAEYVALAAAGKAAVWIRNLMEDLSYPQNKPPEIYIDNTSALKLAHNLQFHQRSKHNNVRFHFIPELISKNITVDKYLITKNQAAAMFTKPLQKA